MPKVAKAYTLRQRIAGGLFLYSLLLAAVVLLFGYFANERIEIVAWRSLLETETSRYLEHAEHESRYPLPASGAIRGYLDPGEGKQSAMPEALRTLGPGFHHDIDLDGHPTSVLVKQLSPGHRLYMTVNAESVEENQRYLLLWSTILAVTGITALVAVTYWLAGRLMRPVSRFAAAVDALKPGPREQRLLPVPKGDRELASIAEAINGYLGRIDTFVDRERVFINTMSHELRTPLAVLQGSADVLEARSDISDDARKAVHRMQRTLRDSDQLVDTLLMLARDPERLSKASESVAVDELLRGVVTDHLPLLEGGPTHVEFGKVSPVVIHAPPQAVQIAVSNLVRNAIEHGGVGTIQIDLSPAAELLIKSPSQGLAPEEIARQFTERARRGDLASGGGLGLPLVMRLCEHMGWMLEMSEAAGGWTQALLRLKS